MTARWAWAAAVGAILGVGGGCGGGGGGGGDGGSDFLPLLEDDELVSLSVAPDASSNNFVAASVGSRVYVAWAERSNVVPDAIRFNRSVDGGRTWLEESVLLSDPDEDAGSVAIACIRDFVYVAFASRVGVRREIRLNRSLDSGQTFLASAVTVSDVAGQTAGTGDPTVCCDGATVHVAWTDDRDGERDIRYNRSTDAGATFPAPDRRLDSGIAGSADSINPRMCCAGPRVFAAWVDHRAGQLDPAIRSNRSLDGGGTFLAADVAVSHASTHALAVSAPAVVCDDETMAAVWADLRNAATGDIFCNRSVDGGATFLATDRRVDTSAPGTSNSGGPAACLDDGVLHVAWTEFSGGSPVRYNRSEDGGVTFLPAEVPIAPNASADAEPDGVHVVADGSTLVVAFQVDEPPGSPDVHVAVSTDGGESFDLARADTDPPGEAISFQPFVVLDDDRLAVVWADDRDGTFQIRTNRTR